MAIEFTTLSTHGLSNCNSYIKPPTPPAVVHMDDSALDVLLDFEHFKPLTIHADDHISKAREIMDHRTLHAALVIDEHNNFLGIITLDDILGNKPAQLQETFQFDRSELLVKHIMIDKDELLAVDYKNLAPAKVGHVIKTLHELKQHFLLVTEKPVHQATPILRGILLDSHISKQLGTNIREIDAKVNY